MKTLAAAMSALMVLLGSQTTDFSSFVSLPSVLEEKITDSENEVIYTDAGLIRISKEDVEMAAKLVWGEARGIKSDAEKAAVIWCVINRVNAGYGDFQSVITAPYQFTGYRRSNPVTDELYSLSLDVLQRWEMEKRGFEDVGRTLPENYLFFNGSGGRNWFRPTYRGGPYWDWSLPDPYV